LAWIDTLLRESYLKNNRLALFVSDFDYHLPEELIAQTPLPERGSSRMMVLHRRSGEITHSRFSEIPQWLSKGEVLVLNSSRVIPAKVWGAKEDGRPIEFLFLKEREKKTWEVLCRPARRVRVGDEIYFSRDFTGEVVKEEAEGKRVIRFPGGDVIGRLKKTGFAPLPPYIKRKKDDTQHREMDLDRYQTVFAREDGSIAAPTAGLHFTPQLLEKIKSKGTQVCTLSLDVGLATFQPVRVNKVEDHDMLEETYVIPTETARSITNEIKEGHPIIAVGTTSVRALDSAYKNGRVRPGRSSTRLFIYPGYTFRVVGRLLTNFHLPRSTLLMLVSAFAGLEFIQKAYAEAVRHKYRFYSYGDCMLIL
jgi:S-adenosylmethionine:tRNA ribosyltransferase-isomerase